MHGLASQNCRPGDDWRLPTISPVTTHTTVCRADAWRCTQETETSKGILAEENQSSGRRPCKGKTKQPQNKRNPTSQRQEHNRQQHQRPAGRATATSKHGRARQESFECGPTSLPPGSWNVMPAATRKFGRIFQVARFENLSECCQFARTATRSAAPFVGVRLRLFDLFNGPSLRSNLSNGSQGVLLV